MNDQQTSNDKNNPNSRPTLLKLVWVFLAVLLAVIAWQQLQINQLGPPTTQQEPNVSTATQQTTPPPNPAVAKNNVGRAGPEAITNARRLLEQRARQIQQLNPEATGQRMFEELKYVTDDDQSLLAKLAEHLIIEGRQRRQLEQQASQGEIQQEQLTTALRELADNSETYAKDLLTPTQFNRYREVRQSWRRGRAHQDAQEAQQDEEL